MSVGIGTPQALDYSNSIKVRRKQELVKTMLIGKMKEGYMIHDTPRYMKNGVDQVGVSQDFHPVFTIG